MYNSMSKEDVMKRLTLIQDNIQEAKNDLNDAEKQQLDAISEAMEQLKAEYDRDNEPGGELGEEMERPVVESAPEEYVEFEEVKGNDNNSADIQA